MTDPNYQRALNRSDLSQWVVHLVRSTAEIHPGQYGYAGEILTSIINEGKIRPSLKEHVARFAPEGAACFYDSLPKVWPEIAATNPNGRPLLGIMCLKNVIWALGGRPVIYTDLSNPDFWPESERFRLVHTDLTRVPGPIDWTHEREWRVRGGLSFNQPQFNNYLWWWPVVPNIAWTNYLFQTYSGIHEVYDTESHQFRRRNIANWLL